MADKTKIEWTDATFNPWVGCTKLSPACDNCYAETWARRTGHPELWQGERRRTSAAYWQQPLKWNRRAEADGRRLRVFCASLADVFDNQVPERWRDDLWHRIEQTPHLDWLLLTKRPQNVAKMLPDPRIGVKPWGNGWPNVWLGTTAENQEEADRRIPLLLQTPAAARFVSAEPLLGPIDLRRWVGGPDEDGNCLRCGCLWDDASEEHECPPGFGGRLDWIIVGGESGPNARPMHPDWARSLRDQCANAGVAYFLKQWGEWGPVARRDDLPGRPQMIRAGDCFVSIEGQSHVVGTDLSSPLEGHGSEPLRRVGKRRAGRLLDGREWNELPKVRHAR